MTKLTLLSAAVCGLTVSACTADQIQEGFDRLGGGLVASQSANELGAIDLALLDPSDKSVIRPHVSLATTPPPTGEPYQMRFSPDVAGEQLLTFSAVADTPPEVHVFRVRDGVRTIYVSSSMMDQAYDEIADLTGQSRSEAEDLVTGYLLADAWWSDEDHYVLRIDLDSDAQLPISDLLLRYDSRNTSENVPPVEDAVFVDPGTPASAVPNVFAPAEHPHGAGNRLSISPGGDILIDGSPTSGGPSDVVAARAVIYIRP